MHHPVLAGGKTSYEKKVTYKMTTTNNRVKYFNQLHEHLDSIGIKVDGWYVRGRDKTDDVFFMQFHDENIKVDEKLLHAILAFSTSSYLLPSIYTNEYDKIEIRWFDPAKYKKLRIDEISEDWIRRKMQKIMKKNVCDSQNLFK